MRAVVYNNLLVSGLLWGDQPGRLLRAVADGSLLLFLSEPLLAELREVLNRDKFARRLALKHLTAETAVASVHSQREDCPGSAHAHAAVPARS